MMSTQDEELEFRGLSGRLVESPFTGTSVSDDINKRLSTARYAWLTTVDRSGIPVPTLVWFRFDGKSVTVYSPPRASRITHIFEHPQVSLHLESDGTGSRLIVAGGHAAVTAEALLKAEKIDLSEKAAGTYVISVKSTKVPQGYGPVSITRKFSVTH